MKVRELKSYAKLIAEKGVNVQKGQDVIINASVENSEFVEYVVEACYKAGARKVSVDWVMSSLTFLNYKYQSLESLQEFPKWLEEKWVYKQKTLPALIYIDSDDPDGLKGIDQEKQMAVNKVVRPLIWKYRAPMEEHYQWCIVGFPGLKWAKKLFPKESNKKAMELLWEAIKTTTRLNGDPVENWKKHQENLECKTNWLNGLGIKTLTYKNSLGTDFSIDLMKESIFCAGSGKTREGVVYNPNMPTEECFTSPDKFTANGVVYASKPLSLMGEVLENFGFRFENGRVVEVLAEKESDKVMLEKLTSMDEGAGLLGEVALVPFDSPVNQTGLLFYNTLYDENAVCHLAVGRGFEECIRDVEKLSEAELKALPLNESVVHTDFMIGTADLTITAELFDGTKVEIFKDGTWAK